MNSLLTPLSIARPRGATRWDALDLAHAFLPGAVRPATVAVARSAIQAGAAPAEGLFAAYRGEKLVGAVWGQVHPGRTAVANPPQVIAGESQETALALLAALEQYFGDQGVQIYQVQLAQTAAMDERFFATLADCGVCAHGNAEHATLSEPTDNPLIPSADAIVLAAAGLRHAADLLFLTSDVAEFPHRPPDELEFEPFRDSERGRLAELIERTYLDSRDLPELEGLRGIDDVLDGYQHTGTFQPAAWRFVRRHGRDVGCLLLAEHSPHRQWEVVYMGLTPEARGRGWGFPTTRFAQYYVRRAGGERLLLAVDSRNVAAIRTYLKSGFQWWRRRAVFLKPLGRDLA